MKNIQIISLGRLGNQMFIYAFVRRLVSEFNCKATIIDRDGENRLTCFSLDNRVSFSRKLKLSLKNRIGLFIYQLLTRGGKSINKITEIEKRYQKLFSLFALHLSQESCLDPVAPLKNTVVLGYFQSEQCFSSIKDIVREDFTFSDVITQKCHSLAQKIEESNSCCIHIRRGDYLQSNVFGVCTDSYYKRAIHKMREINPSVKFFVFSDNIEDVKSSFSSFLGLDTVYIPVSYTDQESLYLGSKCKNFIISNSTFSWWMQYLSANKLKKVIAPTRWYNDNRHCFIYQNNWILVEP